MLGGSRKLRPSFGDAGNLIRIAMPGTTTIAAETPPSDSSSEPAYPVEEKPMVLSKLFLFERGGVMILQVRSAQAVNGVVNLDRITDPSPAEVHRLRQHAEAIARRHKIFSTRPRLPRRKPRPAPSPVSAQSDTGPRVWGAVQKLSLRNQ